MADVPAAGTAHAFDFADGKGRKIIMQHEGPQLFAAEGFHPLFILTGTQGQHAQHLGFAAGEQGAAVGPGKDARPRR